MYDMEFDPTDDSKNEVLQYVKNNGQNGIVYIEYSYKQLGLTDEWLRDMYNKIANPLTVRREILLQRLRGSDDSPFEREDIEYIISVMKTPIDELYIMDHFRFDIYEELDRTIPYIVSVDCSTGTNGDNNAITILNPYTVKPVAEFSCPYIGETMYEKLIIELVRKHLPRAIIVIERNSVGDGIIDHLLNTNIRNNLYFDKGRDLVETNLQDQSTVTSMLKKMGEQKKFYGVYTGPQSREDMMTILTRHMAEFKDNFVTKNITEDITHLVRAKSGKILAGPSWHDDSVMSYLIGLYVYYHGNNLAMFGFVPGSREIENKNKGIITYEDMAYSGIISQRDLQIIKEKEEIMKENDYEEMMRQALLKSQHDTRTLQQSKLISNTIYDNTPDVLLDDLYEENMDMSLFDELNNL